MASDIKILYNNTTQTFDLQYTNGDLLRENGLETAVLISLFTDRRANVDDALINPGEYRGWWGDYVGNDTPIGSRLWLIKGQKATQQNVILAKQYIQEALQWMIDDGVVAKIDVQTEATGRPEHKVLACVIKLYYTDFNIESIKFEDLWNAQITGV